MRQKSSTCQIVGSCFELEHRLAIKIRSQLGSFSTKSFAIRIYTFFSSCLQNSPEFFIEIKVRETTTTHTHTQHRLCSCCTQIGTHLALTSSLLLLYPESVIEENDTHSKCFHLKRFDADAFNSVPHFFHTLCT